MVYRVEIREKIGIFDAVGSSIERDIKDLGIDSVEKVHFIQVYIIEGDLSEDTIRLISEQLLVDNVVQDYSLRPQAYNVRKFHTVEIAYNPGVMDPVEDSVLKGIKDLGINGVDSVRTAKKYLIKGKLYSRYLDTIIYKLLCNKVIQHVVRDSDKYSFLSASGYKFNLIHVDILNANDNKLKNISKQGQLFLNLDEMRQIKRYFKKLGRNPTDCELETLAQTWSEHCGHKTFKGRIEYKEVTSNQKPVTRIINNLLKSTIMKVTKELNKPWCVSVFQDNSGVIRFDDEYNVCFKVETHNHPSAIEPFGGANTGIGGVIRDPLGTGLGAKPILNTDVFCFGPPDSSFRRLPSGCLHPKRIMKGVVAGVRDYGNKMGIPTANGAILFDEGYTGNPLVYCGTVGIMPKDKSAKSVKSGDLVVLVGGRTGRDGIHGATFSSGELTKESEQISSSAVQIGNPIQEKKMLDTILTARDKNLYNAITDCGGGGLSSAVGEMGQDLGVSVDLEKVPLKYEGLSYTEIWISEAQERMILAVPKEKLDELLDVFKKEDVEATVIGEFSDDRRLKLFYAGNLVCDLEMRFLHDGLPRMEKKAIWVEPKFKEPRFSCPKDLTGALKKLLLHYNICSKEWVIRQYDHEVGGGSILKPLVGEKNDGPSDACIVKPRLDAKRGLIVSCGINFKFGFLDPYWMAASCIDETLRQIIAVGGNLKRVAILDNFCWGNPDKPDRLGSLVRAALGCYHTAKKYGVPFISGKDSLNNEYRVSGKSRPFVYNKILRKYTKGRDKSISIPGTLLISGMAVMEDVSTAISMQLKQPGSLIYVVGNTFAELGGSHYFDLFGFVGNNVPRVDCVRGKHIFERLSKATGQGLVASCHDCSEGGLGVALAEMAFSGGLGVDVFLPEVPYRGPVGRNDFILFSESNTRFVVEVERKKQEEFEKILKGVPSGLIGCVSKYKDFKVYGLDGKICVKADIEELKETWQKPLRW